MTQSDAHTGHVKYIRICFCLLEISLIQHCQNSHTDSCIKYCTSPSLPNPKCHSHFDVYSCLCYLATNRYNLEIMYNQILNVAFSI